MALEYPSMTPQTNDQAYDIVSQIWSKDCVVGPGGLEPPTRPL